MKKHLQIILIILLSITCSCADKKEKTSAEIDYVKAFQKLKDRDYSGAADGFKKVNDEYPVSRWGMKAQIMAAYSFYKADKLDDVITTVDDFIHSNPANADVPYMSYLKAIAHYDQMSDITRGQDNAKAASTSFRELIARFPNSAYANDAKEKLILVDEHLAGGKMAVGRYQLNNGNYVGAIKNFEDVVNNYARTNQTPEAYFRLFEAHRAIGLNNEAENYKRELDRLYPGNKWTKPESLWLKIEDKL